MTDKWAGVLWQRFKDLYGQKWIALFQGDEAIETWRVTWASGLDVTAEQIRHALSLIGTQFPDWPPTFGQFKGLCDSAPKPYVQIAPPKYIAPTPESKERFARVLATLGKPKTGHYWTPDKVENDAQVNFIIIQANRFGPASDAGRFLAECKAYGCIGADNQLQFVPRAAA